MRRGSAPSWWALLTASGAFGIPQGQSGRVLSNFPLVQSVCPRAWRYAPERTSMTKIKFIEARFADPDEDEPAIRRRFEWHLRKLRAVQEGVSPQVPGDFEDELRWNEDLIAVRVSEKDCTKVARRARRVVQARKKVSGLSHLATDDRRALEALRNGAELVQIENEHRADEIASAIHAEMPWMTMATDFLWKAMRRSVRVGAQPHRPGPPHRASRRLLPGRTPRGSGERDHCALPRQIRQ